MVGEGKREFQDGSPRQSTTSTTTSWVSTTRRGINNRKTYFRQINGKGRRSEFSKFVAMETGG